jgi:hypothetical protein
MRFRWITAARRTSGAVAVLAGGALAASAIAGAPGPPDNEYEGRAEGDNTTYVGFDVVKRNGQRKVKAVSALLHYECQSGSGGSAFIRAQGGIKVNGEGRFAGTVRSDELPTREAARGGASGTSYLFKGRLRSEGRAKGRIDANLVFPEDPPRGGASGERCYSGELDWRARRGAEVLPTLPPREQIR